MFMPVGKHKMFVDRRTYIGADDRSFQAAQNDYARLIALGCTLKASDPAPHPNGDHIIGTPGNS
jgi:hypothetical protein